MKYRITTKDRVKLIAQIPTRENVYNYLRKTGQFMAYIEDVAKESDKTQFYYGNLATREAVEYNGNVYYHDMTGRGAAENWYIKLPPIYDDDVFSWSYNKKYDTREATIQDGIFEFRCREKANGKVVVDVVYTKCDNRHKNKVTLAEIEVLYGSNETILDAISEWKSQFAKEIIA